MEGAQSKSCNPNPNPNPDQLLEAQTQLWTHMLNHIDSMSLKCAVELGIPQAIHDHGNPTISLSNLLSSLSIPTPRKPHLRRLMQLLAHSGIINEIQTINNNESFYSLTPISNLLVVKNKDDDHVNLSSLLLAVLHPVVLDSFRSMSAWFKSEEDPSPFSIEHGFGFWEVTGIDPKFNKLFNEGLGSDSEFLIRFFVDECAHHQVLQGVKTLVDVGGGTGSAARAIAEAYPDIKCSVLDLAQVVNDVKEEEGGVVEYIAGDMFEYIPPSDAVLLKCVLHDWRDEDCVKILKKCKEAITTCKQEEGKVIIIDQVKGLEASYQNNSTKAQLYCDMKMLVLCEGAEREEHEWLDIFTQAGFKNYKIIPALGLRSIIELYP